MTSLDVIKDRYAKGEVSKEEFDKNQEELKFLGDIVLKVS